MASSNRTIYWEDGSKLKLTSAEFLAAGGEGEVYKKGTMIYKLYLDTQKDYSWLEEKAHLLLPLGKDRRIVAPEDVLYDQAKRVIGYCMPYVKGDALVQAFSTVWWNDNAFDHKQAEKLVRQMQDIVGFVHSNKALMVDGNELNYLIKDGTPYAIDVDSWQIGRFHATAIMPSIRDYTTNTFSEVSDWYAWAVITFQLWTGIHPYRGRHPKFKMGQIAERTKAHCSVFHPDSTYPTSIRDFGAIPSGLLGWYKAIFEGGKREKPPENYADGVKATPTTTKVRMVTAMSGNITTRKLFWGAHPILEVMDGNVVVDAFCTYHYHAKGATSWPIPAVASLPELGGALALAIQNDFSIKEDFLSFNTLTRTIRPITLTGHEIIVSGNRLFLVQDTCLVEFKYHQIGYELMQVVVNQWPVHSASLLFPRGSRAGIFSVLGGHFYVIMPVGENGCLIKPVPQLDGRRVVSVWGQDYFLTCITLDPSGDYIKHEFFFDQGGSNEISKYWSTVVDVPELNVAITNKGTVVTISKDGEMVLFSSSSSTSRQIQNPAISMDMKLVFRDNRMMFYKGSELWDISLS